MAGTGRRAVIDTRAPAADLRGNDFAGKYKRRGDRAMRQSNTLSRDGGCLPVAIDS
ncbi:hypothetical protein ACS15_4564 [Ralstonia insidiosa]|uniref:Uncharacterized protein n=1 Tax=Ralstonia insidiosa TaxID=190721 RepID=A0AAC9BLB6_9RALS|nr:hypothetical protein ACS15_4564 [Ralstonia insidiosa]